MKNRLQEIRWKKDWSLTQLSKKSGVPKPTITLIENGMTKDPRISTALRLAHALNVDVEEIFYERWLCVKKNYVKLLKVQVTKDNKLIVLEDTDHNTHSDAGRYAEKQLDENVIYIGIPC